MIPLKGKRPGPVSTAPPKGIDPCLATSRKGRVLDTRFLEELGKQARLKSYTVVVFGSPKQGVESILAREGTDLSKYQCETLNTVPGQGTATVRTEEAVWATLSVLNLVR